MSRHIKGAILLLLLVAALAAPVTVLSGSAVGQAVLRPPPEAVLRLQGKAVEGILTFTVHDIEALATQTILARPPWSSGVERLEGIPLARLLDGLGSNARLLELRDARGHSVGLEVADALASGAFIAVRRAGKPLSATKRGPFWLVYPHTDTRTPPAGIRLAMAGLVELRLD